MVGLALRHRRDLGDVLRPDGSRAGGRLGDGLAVTEDRVQPPDALERERGVLLDDLVHCPAEVNAPPLAALEGDLLLLRVAGAGLDDLRITDDGADRADPLGSTVV